MSKQRLVRKRKFSFLNFLPTEVKRVFFVATLYDRLCKVSGIKCDEKAMVEWFPDLIPRKESLKFPMTYTDKLWPVGDGKVFNRENIVSNTIKADELISLTPDWMLYTEAWMNDDLMELYRLLLSEVTIQKGESQGISNGDS